jgi:CheY-like chemotaxis protein
MIKLQNAGYSVLTAENGEQAYELAVRHHPDLIITDYQMPLLSGVELCARLRSEPGLSEVPTVLLTARGFSLSGTDMDLGNIRMIIDKPFSPRGILAAVNDLLLETVVIV